MADTVGSGWNWDKTIGELGIDSNDLSPDTKLVDVWDWGKTPAEMGLGQSTDIVGANFDWNKPLETWVSEDVVVVIPPQDETGGSMGASATAAALTRISPPAIVQIVNFFATVNGNSSQANTGQKFVPEQSMHVVSADMPMSASGGGSGGVDGTVNVHLASNLTPTILTSGSFTKNGAGAYHVVFSPAIDLIAGTPYYILVPGPGCCTMYAGGEPKFKIGATATTGFLYGATDGDSLGEPNFMVFSLNGYIN